MKKIDTHTRITHTTHKSAKNIKCKKIHTQKQQKIAFQYQWCVHTKKKLGPWPCLPCKLYVYMYNAIISIAKKGEVCGRYTAEICQYNE